MKKKRQLLLSEKNLRSLPVFFNEIIIIEVKAQQGFNGHQLDDMIKDKEIVEELTEEFSMGKKVRIFLLHSSLYSPTDTRVKNLPRFTWKDLSDLIVLMNHFICGQIDFTRKIKFTNFM